MSTLTKKDIDAIYENGVLRPLETLEFKEHQKVRITVEPRDAILDDLIDYEFMAACAVEGDDSVTLEEVRTITAKMSGSLSQFVIAERNER